MIRHAQSTSLSVAAIEVGERRRQPSPAEVDRMVESFQKDGQLVPIGVRQKDGVPTLIYGATRVATARQLGLSEIRADIFDGTDAEFELAEIVENLERRHLDAASQKELTRLLVELREREITAKTGKEFADTASDNSSSRPASHPKVKVEGAKRGRPRTPSGQAKQDVARQQGVSARTIRRRTSTRRNTRQPAADRAATSASRAQGRLDRVDRIGAAIASLREDILALDRDDRHMVRKQWSPWLDHYINPHGHLIGPLAASASNDEANANADQDADVPDPTADVKSQEEAMA